MPRYSFRYVDNSGKVKTEHGHFQSEGAVKEEVAAGKGTVLEVKQVREAGSSKVNTKALQTFTEMISMLLTSGHTLSHALKLFSELPSRSRSGKAAKVMSSKLLQEIEKGNSFAQALESSASSIPDVYQGLVAVGERSGNLPPIMVELNAWLKTSRGLWTKIVTAALYPLLILISLTAVMAFFVFALLPNFVQSIGSISTDAAEQLANTSTALSIGTLTAIAAFALIPILILIYRGSRKTGSPLATTMERMVIAVPVFGRLVVLREMVSLQFALQTLSSGGVPLEEAIDIAQQSVSLLIFKQALGQVRQSLLSGDSLSESFAAQEVFPQELTSWARIGEETGNVKQIFAQLKQYYQQELDILIQRVSDLIFPILIILVGIVLLLVVVNVILPILNSLYSSTGF